MFILTYGGLIVACRPTFASLFPHSLESSHDHHTWNLTMHPNRAFHVLALDCQVKDSNHVMS
jgi:hypothetical protein